MFFLSLNLNIQSKSSATIFKAFSNFKSKYTTLQNDVGSAASGTESAYLPENNKSRTSWKLRSKGGNFVDFRRVTVHGGAGGSGCVSFAREMHLPKGPPNGGNGGSGGNVYFIADINETSLTPIPSKIAAESGKRGKGKDLHGHKGKDLYIRVPVGTVLREVQKPNYEFLELYDFESRMYSKSIKYRRSSPNPHTMPKNDDSFEMGEEGYQSENRKKQNESALEKLYEDVEKERIESLRANTIYTYYPMKVIKEEATSLDNLPEEYVSYLYQLKNQTPLEYDFNAHGQQVAVCMGGIGGNGNPYFASPANRSPFVALNGLMGQIRVLELELKTVADVGLVGMPNAGKSTFISAVSNAHPKIAPFPFTTLNPYIGTVDLDKSHQITIADIPGIIKGAHMNKGLGHSFLRHIERSKVLAYVIDLSKSNPWNDLAVLQSELELYKPGLSSKPSVVIANKADLHSATKSNYEAWTKFATIPIVPVSSKEAKNIKKIIRTLESLVKSVK